MLSVDQSLGHGNNHPQEQVTFHALVLVPSPNEEQIPPACEVHHEGHGAPGAHEHLELCVDRLERPRGQAADRKQ